MNLTDGLKPYLLLSLFCLALFVPGQAALPPMDRDESRFIQATRQMLETRDFVRIQFQDEMRAKKPAGVYWLQAAAVDLLSHPASTQVWPYRLPSALAAWAAVLMTFGFGRALVGPRPALLGAVLLGSSLMLASESHLAKTDAVLLAITALSQFILVRFYVAGRTRALAGGGGGCSGGPSAPLPPGPGVVEALVFWLAMGAGILIKGPVVPVIALLTLASLGIADRSIGWFNAMKPILGVAVAAAVAAPWFVAISSATGGAFVDEAVKQDLLPKLLGAQESHGGFPGLYLLLASMIFWPGSLLLWPAVAKLWGQRGRLVFRALLAWAIPTWLMFEIIPTKLPHYVLPAFPALALMVAALACEGLETFRHRLARAWYVAWLAIGILLAGAIVALPVFLGSGFTATTLPAALAVLVTSALPAWLAWQGRTSQAGLALGLTALAAYPAIFQQVLPSLDKMFLSREVAQVVGTLGSDGPVAAAGYAEPSLVFLLGTQTRLGDGAAAAAHLKANPRALAVVSDKEEDSFRTAAARDGLAPQEMGAVSGLNYSRGKKVTLKVWGLP